MPHRPPWLLASLLVPLVLAIGASACTFSAPVAGDGPPPATVTVGFDGASTLADERSGEIEIGVVLSEPTDVPVTVGYEIAGGTATPLDDFDTGNSTVTISPGETRGVFLLTITEDVTPEADETIELVLVGPSGARIGAANAHQVRINANVLPRVQFMTEASSADEPTDALLAVVLDKASGFDITATFAVAAGSTATPGSDYAIAIGMLTFTAAEQQAGTLTKSIPLDVVDDALDEDPETVVVTLEAATNAVLATTNQTWTHTIVDEDPEPNVAFTAPASAVAEGGATANLEVRLSAVSGRDVTVPFTLDAAGSSATATTDFAVATASPLTIPAGMLTAPIAVTIVQDTADEPNETVAITLGNATNAGEAAPLTHTLTITDDDLACFGAPNSASDVCFNTAPQGAVALSGTINTSTSTLCQAVQPIGWVLEQDEACVIAGATITVNAATTITGGRPLVLVGAVSVEINSLINASSEEGGNTAPAAPSMLCKAFAQNPGNSASGGGGGAGGSFMTAGGNGGTGNVALTTAGEAATADATPPARLRGGCSGQRGGNATGGQNGGPPGLGGGAVYVVSGGTITFGNNGGINVSGAGGGAGGVAAGGSGGGSGGMIQLFGAALAVNNSSKLVANGGGGSSGGSAATGGNAGLDPAAAAHTTPAAGGSGGGGDGGNGFAGATGATPGIAGIATSGGGGGGGAGGFILSNKSLGNADVSAGSIVITP